MIPTKGNPLGAAFPIEDVSAFQVRITEADISGSTAYMTVGISSTSTFMVYWGDGNSSAGTGGTHTHTYSAAGVYTIKITGVHTLFSFFGGGTQGKVIRALKMYSGVTSGYLTFYYCTNLRLAADFRLQASVTNGNSFLTGCDLGALPSGFRFPANTVNLNEALRGNPNMVFDISHLFPDWPSGATVNLTRICHGDTNLTGTAPAAKLWEREDVTFISTGAFYGCTGLTNYADIPSGWK